MLLMEDCVSDALCGELTEGGHILSQRIYYEDTDFSGLVYHARYLHFLERGRTDYLRCLGVQQGGMVEEADGEGVAFVVRHMNIDFRSPARMDDIITIETQPHRVGGAKLILDQSISCGDRRLIEARVTIAVINRHGRPRRLPGDLAERFGVD